MYWQETLLEFRAGKMLLEGKRVVPDTRKGLIRIAKVLSIKAISAMRIILSFGLHLPLTKRAIPGAGAQGSPLCEDWGITFTSN